MSLRVEKIGWDDSFRFAQTRRALESSIASGDPRVYIFSAFKDSSSERPFNTTSHLIKLSQACANGSEDWAMALLNHLKTFHHEVVSADSEKASELRAFVDERFAFLESMIHDWFRLPVSDRTCPTEVNDYTITTEWGSVSLLGEGEELAAGLYARALEHVGAKKVMGWDLMTPREGDERVMNDVTRLREQVSRRVNDLLVFRKTPILPGYIGPLEWGILARWGRGYSDVTASEVFQSLTPHYPGAEFAIKKAFVVCSADPRVVGNVRRIRRLNFPNLLEMVGSRGALGKFVNPHALDPRMLSHGGVLRIYSEDDLEGTLITRQHAEGIRGIQFIQLKDVVVVNVESDFMHLPGYIEAIGAFFRKHGISIDNMISSQTVITITLNQADMKSHAPDGLAHELLQELRRFENSTEEDTTRVEASSLTELYIGGEDFDRPGLMRTITDTLSQEGINIETSAQPKNPRVMIIGVATVDATRALKALHERLIEEA